MTDKKNIIYLSSQAIIEFNILSFIITKHFLLLNEVEFNIKDEPQYAKIMTGIRENYYTDNEIKNWIKYGQIREFKRFQ